MCGPGRLSGPVCVVALLRTITPINQGGPEASHIFGVRPRLDSSNVPAAVKQLRLFDSDVIAAFSR